MKDKGDEKWPLPAVFDRFYVNIIDPEIIYISLAPWAWSLPRIHSEKNI